MCAMLAGCERADEPELRVFAAATLSEALPELAKVFRQREGVVIRWNFAASGTLARQISAGGRADVFISAAPRWIEELENDGHLVTGSARPVAADFLALVSHRDGPAPATGLCGRTDLILATGDPDYVPLGSYVRQWLENVPCADGVSLWESFEGRRSLLPDATAALAQAEASPRVLAAVYGSGWKKRQDTLRLICRTDPDQPPPVVLVAAATGTGGEAGTAFLDFLTSSDSAAILANHGFEAPPATP